MNHPSPTARLSNSLERDGLAATARKCVLAPCRQIRSWRQRYDRWRLNRSSDPQVIFQMIHRLNVWDDSESVSGPGSTLDYTTTLRQHLPLVFQQQAVRTLFDGNNNRLGRSLDGFRSDCARRFANGLHRLGVNVIDEVFGHAASIIKEEARQTALPGQ